MTIPYRGQTSHSTYFVSASCFEKKSLLQSDRSAQLFVDVLYHYRAQNKYQIHEFVIMPDHFHLLITPESVSLERTMQLIKAGFSFRMKKELGVTSEIWQTTFHDRRVRDTAEYQRFRRYIHENPVKRGLVISPAEYPYGSSCGKYELDDVPQRLKPTASRS